MTADLNDEQMRVLREMYPNGSRDVVCDDKYETDKDILFKLNGKGFFDAITLEHVPTKLKNYQIDEIVTYAKRRNRTISRYDLEGKDYLAPQFRFTINEKGRLAVESYNAKQFFKQRKEERRIK